MPKITQSARDTWPEAMATVTACKYESSAGRAMAFGLPTTRYFRITFNYWAPNPDGTPELHTGELTAAKAMPQGTLFPIHYNPETPHENTHSAAEPALTRTPLLIIGILGSAVLSLAWLLILRGCTGH
jgi:hypothetical protein